MTKVLEPHLETLPAAQRLLLPELRPAAALGFALYGGTAIALRLGHRQSVDFDFFSDRPLDRHAMRAAFPFMAQATALQDRADTLTVLVPAGDAGPAHVKLSFFGSIGFGRVGEPDISSDGLLHVASLDDLMATKLKVILQRAEAKDYRDIAAMLGVGVDLAKGLSAARAMFGRNFQPSESLKALVYFEDGDLGTLSGVEKTRLASAVSAVRDLPPVAILGQRLIATLPSSTP